MQGEMIGIVLEGHDAIARVRKMVGSTLPENARPGTIRADFGRYAAPRNIIHASDSLKAVDREIELFFGESL
jgi:nucleoside-diphosphate kinase